MSLKKAKEDFGNQSNEKSDKYPGEILKDLIG